MDLEYRCGWEEEERKKEKQTREEFEKELMKVYGRAIEKFTEMRLRVEFKTAHEMFTYAKISYRKKRGMIRESIFIKCPKCGKVGKLRRNRRHYYIYHKYQSCHIGTCSEFYDFVDEIYRMYRSRSSLTEEKRRGVKRSVFIDIDGDCEVWRDEG